MSCNNPLSCYSSYYCNLPCVPVCQPCQTVCCTKKNKCTCNECTIQCPSPAKCPPIVIYITLMQSAVSIPSGTVGVAAIPIPPGSIYPPIPAGTVTLLNGFSGLPLNNCGGITVNNGFFTIPISGTYAVSATIGISANATGDRQFYIYLISAATNVISLLSLDSRNAVATGSTYANVFAEVSANPGDQIFFAATQNSGSVLSTTTDSRFAIVRVSNSCTFPATSCYPTYCC